MTDNLILDLDYEWVIEPIRARIILNDLVLHEGLLDKNRYECSIQLLKDNCLRVYLLNKPRGSTKVDQAGNILKDTYINISNIKINDRKFRYAINDCGKVVNNDGSIFPHSSKICFEGYYEIKFTAPIGKFLQSYYSPFGYNKDVEKSIKSLTETIESLK